MSIRYFLVGFVALIASGTAAACPDVSLMGAEVMNFSSDDIWEKQTVEVVAGGTIDLLDCPDIPGSGNVIKEPDFTFQYNRNKPYDIKFDVDAFCDTILLINDADGVWHWNDDASSNQDPAISLGNASGGVIDVWVGTFDDENCQAQLNIEAFSQ